MNYDAASINQTVMKDSQRKNPLAHLSPFRQSILRQEPASQLHTLAAGLQTPKGPVDDETRRLHKKSRATVKVTESNRTVITPKTNLHAHPDRIGVDQRIPRDLKVFDMDFASSKLCLEFPGLLWPAVKAKEPMWDGYTTANRDCRLRAWFHPKAARQRQAPVSSTTITIRYDR